MSGQTVDTIEILLEKMLILMRTGRGNRSSGPWLVTYESILVTTIVFDVSDGVVQTVHLIANPEKLIGVRAVEVL
jgi:hypothetical protein